MRVRSSVVAIALAVTPLGLPAHASDDANTTFSAVMNCGALSTQGRITESSFTQKMNFSLFRGQFRGIRYTRKHPGREALEGAINHGGLIYVSGTGEYDIPTGHAWTYNYRGQLAQDGPTVLEGGLRVPDTGGSRKCQLYIGSEETRILANSVVSSKPTPRTSNFASEPYRPNELRYHSDALVRVENNSEIRTAKVEELKLRVEPSAEVKADNPIHKNPTVAPGEQAPSSSAQGDASKTTPGAPNAPSLVDTAKASEATPVVNGVSSTEAKPDEFVESLQAQIEILTKVLSEQTDLERSAATDEQASFESAVQAVKARIEKLDSDYAAATKSTGRYSTSIKPNNMAIYNTARKASEIYPKIPYYIPGTPEVGEFWVEPKVSEQGELRFEFKFVDLGASVEQVRESINLSLSEVEEAQKALFKLKAWSDIAHKQKLRQNYERRVTCFPVEACPSEGEHVDGKASTEVRFNVYEDGSTAGRIQRNKGRFVEGYNVSIESAMLLQAYLEYVIKEAKTEYDAGTQDQHTLDKLFQ